MNDWQPLLTWYLEANVLLVAGFGFILVLNKLVTTARLRLRQRDLLRFARLVLLAACFAPLVATTLPRHRWFGGADRFWTLDLPANRAVAPSVGVGGPPTNASTLAAGQTPHDAKLPATAFVLLTILAAAIVARSTLSVTSLARLGKLLKATHPLRRIGRLHVVVSDDASVPFSCRIWRRAYIVLPRAMLADAASLRMALRHEGEHHRQGDTTWLFAFEAAALVFPLNPALPLWRRRYSLLQEFACDEALIGRGRVEPYAYGSCLIRVLEAARSRPAALVGTASMATAGPNRERNQHSLERRIVMFERYQRDRGATASRRRLLVIGTTLAGAVFAFAYAARGAKSHEALTKVELEKIVAAMDVNPDVKIEVTDGVLRRVNRYITEPGRNADLKDALERMAKHKPMISSYLEKYDLPTELLAVPMIESGYENLDQATWDKRVKSGEVAGAGLWMFIKPSARDYGLVVDSTRDQRLDPPLETDAAMRLLAANKLRFKDWMLSLAAYNQGEGVVQKAIDQGGTRDAWTLSQKGLLNDYITFFSTAVILINNPQLLD